MNTQKVVPLIKGMIKHIPGAKKIIALGHAPGTCTQSKYCYTVWLRHLSKWSEVKHTMPEVVAEIGPGSSLGTSLAALLTGVNKIYALEVVEYWNVPLNLRIFDELVTLFKQRSAIGDESAYPVVKPKLTDYRFPEDILSEAQMAINLHPDRIRKIRAELQDLSNPNNQYIKVFVPWSDGSIVQDNSVDFIFSQAVLQSIEGIEAAYIAMNRWLKPNGIMSHSIDFKSLGHTAAWNDHWTYSDLEWKILKGGSDFLINRRPASAHLSYLTKYGFKVLLHERIREKNKLKTTQLATQFRTLSEDDLTTGSMYVQAQKI